MKQKCNGEVGTGLADTVIADGFAGSGTSVPGGTGTRSITQTSGAHATGARGKKKRQSEESGEKSAAWASGGALMATMNQNALADQVEAKAGGLEQLAEDVLRLAKRVADLPAEADEDSRETFAELLQDAKEELKAARARKRAKHTEVRI